jgi:hypothetical protein
MRNSRKIAAAAFIVSLSFATLSPATLQAATSHSRAGEPGSGGFMERLIKEIRHILGISNNEDVPASVDIPTVPRP